MYHFGYILRWKRPNFNSMFFMQKKKSLAFSVISLPLLLLSYTITSTWRRLIFSKVKRRNKFYADSFLHSEGITWKCSHEIWAFVDVVRYEGKFSGISFKKNPSAWSIINLKAFSNCYEILGTNFVR